TQNPNLEILWAFNNNLTELDVSQNLNIEYLWLNNNELTEIDLSNNIMLETLYMSFNPLINIDCSSNVNLKDLILWHTELTELDLSNNSNLCRLSMSNNFSLEYINLKNGNNEVFGGGCSTSTLSLLNNPNLQFICVEDAQYAAANFTNIPPLATFV